MRSLKCLPVLAASLSFGVCLGGTDRLDEDVWPAVVPQYLAKPAVTNVTYSFAQPQRLTGGGPESREFVAGKRISFAYDFEGVPPDFAFTGEFALSSQGVICWREPLAFSGRNVIRTDGKGWRLKFDFDLPLYFSSGRYEYGLTIPGFCGNAGDGRPYPNGVLSLTRAAEIPGWTSPVTSCVRELAGTPQFFVNDRPFFPLWGAVTRRMSPSGRHSGMPLNVLTIWSDSWNWHPKTNLFLSAQLDFLAELYRRSNPDAYFMWDLTVYPPPDWKKAHPDQLVADEKGERKPFYRTDYSFASEMALESMKEQVRKAIAHLESSPYANRIVGYRISSGDTPEWLGYSAALHRGYDYSAPCLAAFGKWAGSHYPQLTDPRPDPFVRRMELDNGGDLLWDQSRHLNTIAYYEFYSEQVADMAIAISRLAKDLLGGRKVVGTYHGYTHFLNSTGASHDRAHFAFKKVLDSGAVDFVMSPQSYGVRRLGGPFADMKPFGSIRHHRMVCCTENDMRTHNGPPLKARYEQTLTAEQTVMTMRRDLATELCRNNPAYLYPIASGTDFDFPEMAEEGRIFRILGQHLLDTGSSPRRAQIAYVVSEKSITSLPIHWRQITSGDLKQSYNPDGSVSVAPDRERNILSGEIFVNSLVRWSRAGAPVDYVLAEDLADNPGDYRLYVFAHDFKYDEAFRTAVERIRARGATMLWIYAPGWAYGPTSGLENMKALTGIEFARCAAPQLAGVTMREDGRYMGLPKELVSPLFHPVAPDEVLGTYADGTPGLAAIRQGRSLALFSGAWQLDVPFIRSAVKRAGVFTYVDSTDPTEANDRLFTLHARFAGLKKVRLPRKTDVLDVFDGRIVARDADAFEFDAKLHSTHVFYLGSDADALLARINEGKSVK